MDRARMMAQMGRIIEVVRTFIPSERWPEVQAALRGEAPVSQSDPCSPPTSHPPGHHCRKALHTIDIHINETIDQDRLLPKPA